MSADVRVLSPWGHTGQGSEAVQKHTQAAEAAAERLLQIAAEKREGRDQRVAREMAIEDFSTGDGAQVIQAGFLKKLEEAETLEAAAKERRERTIQHATAGVELDPATAAELRARASRLDRVELARLVTRLADAGDAAMVAALTTHDPAPPELRMLPPDVAADVQERLSRARFPEAWEAIEAREADASWTRFNLNAIRATLERRLGFPLPTPDPKPLVFR